MSRDPSPGPGGPLLFLSPCCLYSLGPNITFSPLSLILAQSQSSEENVARSHVHIQNVQNQHNKS